MKSLSKTKILYIGPIPPEIGGKAVGGIATHCWQLAAEAHNRGYEVYILANTTSSFNKDGVNVMALPRRNKLLKAFYALKVWLGIDKSERSNFNFLSFKEKTGVLYRSYLLQEIIDSVRPALIHVHSLHNVMILSVKIIRSSIPLIVTNHEFYPRESGEKQKDIAIANFNLSATNYLICSSEYTKSRLGKFNLCFRGKLKIIHIPVDGSKLPLLNKDECKRKLGLEKKEIILFIGGYKPIEKKGLDILLKSFYTCPYLLEKCKLIVKSNAEGIKYARQFMARAKVDGLVLQDTHWSEIVNYFNAADLFVMPSRSEGFGLVYAEALLAGTPVVGFHRTLEEMEDLFGIYIGEKFNADKEDERVLAEKIKKVLNTKFDRKLLRKKVIDSLSWEVKFNEFDTVYRELLKEV